MYITDIKAPRGAHKKKKYVGRGMGSGHGKTSTRGHGGQGQRSGRGPRPGFEGGSMPLIRRLPKRGFRAYARKVYQIIKLDQLNKFSKGAVVTPLSLKEEGLIKDSEGLIKLLADGDLTKQITIKVHKISKAAQKKVEAANATLELISES